MLIKAVLATIAVIVAGTVTHSKTYSKMHEHKLCAGFVAENDLNIPVLKAGEKRVGGITQAQFEDVMDRFEAVYATRVKDKGGILVLNRLWSNGRVNANASRQGRNWVINMYGGLARHKTVTYEAMMTVVCHEVGHHLGGFPTKRPGSGYWASNEGQADYYGTLKCLRYIFTPEENLEWVKNNEVDVAAREACQVNFSLDSDIAACSRAAMGGKSLAFLLRSLRKEERNPKFDEPDSSKVNRTSDSHPATQCRMDTYFQGALCSKDAVEDVDREDASVGTCNRSQGFESGVRPLCWYRPEN